MYLMFNLLRQSLETLKNKLSNRIVAIALKISEMLVELLNCGISGLEYRNRRSVETPFTRRADINPLNTKRRLL